MRVLNVHSRKIDAAHAEVHKLLDSLASENDQVWPTQAWPRMILDKGHTIGSKGGHGPIRYFVSDYSPGASITFEFTKPLGLNGTHTLEIVELEDAKTLLRHTIDIKLSGLGFFSWHLAIRWLHDALIEDCFDNLENNVMGTQKITPWSPWVKFLRRQITAGVRPSLAH